MLCACLYQNTRALLLLMFCYSTQRDMWKSRTLQHIHNMRREKRKKNGKIGESSKVERMAGTWTSGKFRMAQAVKSLLKFVLTFALFLFCWVYLFSAASKASNSFCPFYRQLSFIAQVCADVCASFFLLSLFFFAAARLQILSVLFTDNSASGLLSNSSRWHYWTS